MRLGRIPGTALAVGAQVARPGPHFLGPSICGSARPLADRAPRVAPAAPFVSFPAVIVPRLATLKGVGQINIGGGTKYALRIQLNPAALAAAEVRYRELEPDALLEEVCGLLADGNVVGIELLNVSKRLSLDSLKTFQLETA